MEIKRLKILALTVLLFLMSCDNNSKEKTTAPSVVLTEKQMVDIITDVQIIEQAINYRRGKNIKITNLKTKGFDAVFEHYGITDSIFLENLDYYNSNPVLMKSIMDSVNVYFENMKNTEEMK